MRENGYYWVKHKGRYCVMEFTQSASGGFWMRIGYDDWYYDEDLNEIDETPITRTT